LQSEKKTSQRREEDQNHKTKIGEIVMANQHEIIWENCLQVIKDNLPIQAFKTWFEPIKPVKLDNAVLTIQVPSHFFYEWLEEHYVSILRKVIKHTILFGIN
jgi:hypothetical protein